MHRKTQNVPDDPGNAVLKHNSGISFVKKKDSCPKSLEIKKTIVTLKIMREKKQLLGGGDFSISPLDSPSPPLSLFLLYLVFYQLFLHQHV